MKVGGIGAGAEVVIEGIKTANTVFQSKLSCINPILTAYPLESVALIV